MEKKKKALLGIIILILIILIFVFPIVEKISTVGYEDLLFEFHNSNSIINESKLVIGYNPKKTTGYLYFKFINEDEIKSIEISLPNNFTVSRIEWVTKNYDLKINTAIVNHTTELHNNKLKITASNNINQGNTNGVQIWFYSIFPREPSGKMEFKLKNSSNEMIINTVLDTHKYTCDQFCFETNLEKRIVSNPFSTEYLELIATKKNVMSGVVYLRTKKIFWYNLYIFLISLMAGLVVIVISLSISLYTKEHDELKEKIAPLEDTIKNKFDKTVKRVKQLEKFNKNKFDKTNKKFEHLKKLHSNISSKIKNQAKILNKLSKKLK